MVEERAFRRSNVFTDLCLGIIVGLIVCGGAGFAGGLTWIALAVSTIRNNADDVLGDVFFGAGEFDLLRGGDLCIIDGCLVHEVLADGDGSFFKIFGLGKNL